LEDVSTGAVVGLVVGVVIGFVIDFVGFVVGVAADAIELLGGGSTVLEQFKPLALQQLVQQLHLTSGDVP